MKENYSNGDILVIQVNEDLASRAFVYILERKGELFFAPFLMENATPIPLLFLGLFSPICIGSKNANDYQETQKFVSEYYSEQNKTAWTLAADRSAILYPC